MVRLRPLRHSLQRSHFVLIGRGPLVWLSFTFSVFLSLCMCRETISIQSYFSHICYLPDISSSQRHVEVTFRDCDAAGGAVSDPHEDDGEERDGQQKNVENLTGKIRISFALPNSILTSTDR